jgi:hypothetical protein
MAIYNIPYTYVIGWTHLNKYYYGVRYAKKCNPNDLWVTYFTSSKYVRQLRKEEGEPDIKEIRKTFDDVNSAILWEEKVLRRLAVLKNDKWLNRNIAGAIQPLIGEQSPSYGRIKTAKEIEKIRQANIGRKRSVKERQTQSKTLKQYYDNGGISHNKGKKLSYDHKNKIRITMTGQKRPDWQYNGEKHHFFGKPIDENRKSKIKASAIANAVRVTCVTCRVECSLQNYTRWHKNRHLECVDC